MDIVIEKIPVSKLKPAEYNPRRKLRRGDQEWEDIAESFRNFGFVQNLVWNKRSGNLIAGHQRMKIAVAEFKAKEMPCVVVDLDDAKEKQLNIILNKVGEGIWDQAKLAELMNDLNDQNVDLNSLGFSPAEIEELLDTPPVETTTDPDDEAPEPPANPVSIPGDIFTLISADGQVQHRLMCGDSTSATDVKKLMGEAKARILFTDPPYGVDYDNSTRGKGTKKEHAKLENDALQAKALTEFLTAIFANAHAHTVDDCSAYIYHASSTQIEFETALNKSGWKVRSQLIWAKQLALSRADYHWAHEPAFYAAKVGHSTPWFGDRCQTTMFVDEREDWRKCTKDELLEIIEDLIQRSTVWDEKRDPSSSYIHPCLPAGEQVYANGEWKDIEQVRTGDDTEYGIVSQTTSHPALKIFTINLEDGARTRATGNHPFLILRDEQILWAEARHIKAGDVTLTRCNTPRIQKPCRDNQTEPRHSEASPQKDIVENTTQLKSDIEWSTSSSGKEPTDPCRQGGRSTTEMKTNSIIELRTWSLSIPLLTSGITKVAERERTENGSSHAKHAESSNQLPPSIGIFREATSTERNAAPASANEKAQSELFELRKVGSVEIEDHETRVYNLTIEGIPAFDTEVGVSHNTQKPISLARRAMSNSTLPKDNVMDLCGGSGSTLVAAEVERRNSYTMEKSPAFCDAIIARFINTFPEVVLHKNGTEQEIQKYTITK